MVYKYTFLLTQINTIAKELKKIELIQERNFGKNTPKNIAAMYRSLDYLEWWRKHLENNHYDIQLIDGSIIEFDIGQERHVKKFSYSYIACPYDFNKYEEFCMEFDLPKESSFEMYEDYLTSPDIEANSNAITIRYDFDPSNYNPGIHPVSHIHIGFNSNIRIGTSLILDPKGFMMFILRQQYPVYWVLYMKDFCKANESHYERMSIVEKEYLSYKDIHELRLK